MRRERASGRPVRRKLVGGGTSDTNGWLLSTSKVPQDLVTCITRHPDGISVCYLRTRAWVCSVGSPHDVRTDESSKRARHRRPGGTYREWIRTRTGIPTPHMDLLWEVSGERNPRDWRSEPATVPPGDPHSHGNDLHSIRSTQVVSGIVAGAKKRERERGLGFFSFVSPQRLGPRSAISRQCDAGVFCARARRHRHPWTSSRVQFKFLIQTQVHGVFRIQRVLVIPPPGVEFTPGYVRQTKERFGSLMAEKG
ncbi:hypothetical protein LZ30DRAFT_53559 [Colletotrichum cereale]|nr:hypothetical protein LZ30DRAFT_53559 [Colletotrichum cereale]